MCSFYPNFLIFNSLPAFPIKDSAGGGFDDHGGELELHELPLSDQSSSSKLLGKLKAKCVSFIFHLHLYTIPLHQFIDIHNCIYIFIRCVFILFDVLYGAM